ncbi:MAG: hypothetical protein ABIJ46_01080 [bacterium]
MSEEKKPKFLAGAFIFDPAGRLYLRSTPSQNDRFTCINGEIKWGQTIDSIIRENVKKKTNLDVEKLELIGLTDGLDVQGTDGEKIHMIFADYLVKVGKVDRFITDKPERRGEWHTPEEWRAMGQDKFGQYIYEIVEKL